MSTVQGVTLIYMGRDRWMSLDARALGDPSFSIAEVRARSTHFEGLLGYRATVTT